jgi:AraC-like DNA-binding protein
MRSVAPDLPAAERLRRQRIFASPLVDIGVFVAPAGSDYFGDQAPPGHFTVAFPETAVGIRPARGRRFVTDLNVVTYYEPEDAYERHLVDPRGDSCTFFAPAPAVVEEFAADAGLRDSTDRVFGRAFGHCDTATFRRQRRLVGALRRGVEVEQETLGVLDGLARRGPTPRGQTPTPAARRHARRAREYLACHYAEAPDLTTVAAAADCSVFHLSRAFKGTFGYTVHEYRMELALRDAHDRIVAGDGRIADIAFDLGFASHSHLTENFGRRFGFAPSRLRA